MTRSEKEFFLTNRVGLIVGCPLESKRDETDIFNESSVNTERCPSVKTKEKTENVVSVPLFT